MKLIDLTQTFTDDMPVYPGDPKSSLEQVAFIEKDGYNDHKLTTVMHVGTHMDAPLHMIPGGETMDEINPEMFFGKGVLIDVRGKEKIDGTIMEGRKIEDGAVVLLYTGFGEKYRTDAYFEGYPYVTEDFAQKMIDLKVKIVGMDILGPDTDPSWPAHKILLGNEVLIVENLTNLDKLLEVQEFSLIALPAKLHSDAAPVRVIAQIP